MGVIRVSNHELQTLAAQHAAASDELARSMPGPSVGPATQCTSAAVIGGYDVLRAATCALAARLTATGSKLSSAGDRYAVQEADSASSLDAVGVAT